VSPLPCHSHPSPPQLAFFSVVCSAVLGLAHVSRDSAAVPNSPFSFSMAPPQQIRVPEPLPWPQSTTMPLALNELVNGVLLAPADDGMYPTWMVPPASDREPNPPHCYVVSFIRLHERGFTAPVSRFMRGLYHHYGVELHNFAPIAISQAACFAAVYEGYLGISANWDLWVHLFRAELSYSRHGRGVDASGNSCRRPDARTAGHAQGGVPAVHHDLQQRELGEKVVLPPQ
jgi:hypothetical protein